MSELVRHTLGERTCAATEREFCAFGEAAEVGIFRCAGVARVAAGQRVAEDCSCVEAGARHLVEVVARLG